MRQRILNIFAAVALLLVAHLCTAATTDLWKTDKPVRIVVPWAAGGGQDVTARAIATAMSARFNHPFIVDSRPGASGMIGTGYVASSPADGYTLLFGSVDTQVLDPLLFPGTVRYDADKNFDPLLTVGRIPMALVSRQSINAKSAQDLIRLGKDKQGSLSYGSWGVGSTGHLAFLLLEQKTGLELNHIPYNGSPPVYNALLGGYVDFALTQLPWAVSNAKEGKVQILGLTSATRSSFAPAIPTLQEVGFNDYVVELWLGLYAPKGTPLEIREALSREIGAWLGTREAKSLLQSVGVESVPETAVELKSRERNDSLLWQRIIKAKNITVEPK